MKHCLDCIHFKTLFETGTTNQCGHPKKEYWMAAEKGCPYYLKRSAGVKVTPLYCAKCGLHFGVKTPEGFTQLAPQVVGKTCCCVMNREPSVAEDFCLAAKKFCHSEQTMASCPIRKQGGCPSEEAEEVEQ